MADNCFQWHITHRCNLKCMHCYQDNYDQEVSFDDARIILDKYEKFLKDNGMSGQINLTGGEPLLHKNFFDIASEIVRRGIKIGILTNGNLILPKVAERIAALNPVFVQVSLDGDKLVHDEIRGAGNFDRALEGIDNLKKAGVKVLVSFTANRKNFMVLNKVAKICRKHKVDKLWWDRVVTEDKELSLTTEEFDSIVSFVEKNHWRYPRLVNDRALQNSCYSCSAGHPKLLIILANGDVMLCRRLPFVVGNISEINDISVIYNCDIARQLQSPVPLDGCENCDRWSVCKGGARCVTYAQTRKIEAKDINCVM